MAHTWYMKEWRTLFSLIGLTICAGALFLTGWYFRSDIGFAKETIPISKEYIPEYVTALTLRCQGEERPDARYECFATEASLLLNTFSFSEIMRELEGSLSCHDLMHLVAQEEYRRTGDLASLYGQSTYACFGAAYHGGVEGLFDAEGTRDLTDQKEIEVIRSECERASGNSRRVYTQCVHGIGHALMFATKGDVPRSLEVCDTLRGDKPDILNEICYGGVFMENVPRSQLNPHASAYVREGDPYFPCTILPIHQKEVCYTYQLANVPDREGVAGLVSYCVGAPEEYRKRCFRSLGTKLVSRSESKADPVATCLTMPENADTQGCINGVVLSYSDRFAGDAEKFKEMFGVCTEAPSVYKEECYMAAGNLSKYFLYQDQSSGSHLCENLGVYHDACIRGVEGGMPE